MADRGGGIQSIRDLNYLSPLIDGTLLKGIVLNAGAAVQVPHGLSRQPLGWLVADATTSAVIFRTAWDGRTISLKASAGTPTISIWVF